MIKDFLKTKLFTNQILWSLSTIKYIIEELEVLVSTLLKLV